MAIATGRRYIVLHGAISEPKPLVIDNRAVYLLAEPGSATLTASSGGAVVKVTNGATLTAYGIEIDGTRSGMTGISCPGAGSANATTVVFRHGKISNLDFGIQVTKCSLRLTESVISNNVSGGGVELDSATFVIVNNVFEHNGAAGNPFGAISITNSNGGSVNSRLEFNTLFENQAANGAGAGVVCYDASFTAGNNIFFGNGNSTSDTQASGTCNHQYSIASMGAVPAGVGNKSGDPKFVNAAGDDFHIQLGSAAAQAANPQEQLTDDMREDFDGTPRPSRPSCGAFEAPISGGSAR